MGAGRPVEEQFVEPLRYDFVRRVTWDIRARIADMDADGSHVRSTSPPTLGFAGVRLTMLDDPEFVLALVRAYDDWHLEESGGVPTRSHHPVRLPYLLDPVRGRGDPHQQRARGSTPCRSPTCSTSYIFRAARVGDVRIRSSRRARRPAR